MNTMTPCCAWGTADAEAILKRFTRNNYQHPTYKALAELGKALKSIFICRYLRHEAVRREIQEGLNVVENWNSAVSFVFYGNQGEIASNDLDMQEIAILAMHLLQACLTYVNTFDSCRNGAKYDTERALERL